MKQFILSSLFLLYSFTVYSTLAPQKYNAEDSLLYYKKLSRKKKNPTKIDWQQMIKQFTGQDKCLTLYTLNN